MVSISQRVVSGPKPPGYSSGMPPLEELIHDVEVTIVDSVDSLGDDEAALLYAGILDFEQRLDALRDALKLIAAAQA